MKNHKWKKTYEEPHLCYECEKCGIEKTPRSHSDWEYFDRRKIGRAKTTLTRPKCDGKKV